MFVPSVGEIFSGLVRAIFLSSLATAKAGKKCPPVPPPVKAMRTIMMRTCELYAKYANCENRLDSFVRSSRVLH